MVSISRQFWRWLFAFGLANKIKHINCGDKSRILMANNVIIITIGPMLDMTTKNFSCSNW